MKHGLQTGRMASQAAPVYGPWRICRCEFPTLTRTRDSSLFQSLHLRGETRLGIKDCPILSPTPGKATDARLRKRLTPKASGQAGVTPHVSPGSETIMRMTEKNS